MRRGAPLHHDGAMSRQQRDLFASTRHRFAVRDQEDDDEVLTFDGRPVVRQDRVQQVLQRYYDNVSLSCNGRDSLYAYARVSRCTASLAGLCSASCARKSRTRRTCPP